jgi:hypothetical protein
MVVLCRLLSLIQSVQSIYQKFSAFSHGDKGVSGHFCHFYLNKYPNYCSTTKTPMPKMRLGWYAGVSIALVGELGEAIWSYG